ncbi:TetR/AcrR family transcriptional regulator [Massilia sp. CFBP9026]|uniref:TetR family transcriptional regulator n=2 Tax=Massilia aurea TaxID=373040 RepID=A0A422QQQ9_9BURK|nr:TetR/AcrR family transcriptional regulator [Massilia sp. CFBP9026]MDY0960681.1 TetR/AcrR family transcriptional regulator [Massilia sp. CFBP9026]RNF32358.1 TetR family transcriptional regulator [Massilia aurea]
MAQKRADMIVETRGKLIKAAREAFASKGFADSSMDELTAQAGLTRGALYHHFGDKKGLLKAVIAQIDGEMMARLAAILANAPTAWNGFVDESVAYIMMATEPEIQRIMLLDGPAALGDPSQWQMQNACISSTQRSLEKLMEEGTIREVDALATSRLVNGALLSAALWIAHADDPQAVSKQAVDSFVVLVEGLLLKR